MKVSGLINIGILPLLLEAITPAYAQHDQREQEPRQPQQHQEARPERQPQQARPERQQAQPQQARPERQQQPQGRQEGRPERQQPNPERPQLQPKPARQPEQPKPAIRPEPRRPEAPRPARPAPTRAVQPDLQQRGRSPQEHPQQAGPQAQQPPKQDQARPQQARRPVQQVQREYENQNRGAWQNRRAHNWQSEHRTWQDRGGYSGYRIPETRFRGFYGSNHPFRMFGFPLLVVGGFPRFQYGGLWFSVMDPWPEYWADDWYGSDDLYIEFFGGGYYLHNRMHPMDRIAVTVFVG